MFANLSLYLVTDPTPEILKGRDLCTVVEEALKGGLQTPMYEIKMRFFLADISHRRHGRPVQG
jgi:hypothetical protein